jgi:drug/metabolite transporter (DMT)-like permease
MAQTKVHSSLAGILNATTPLFVMIVGSVFFSRTINFSQFIGILTGFVGVLLLFFPSLDFTLKEFPVEALLILPATVMYGVNVNIANRHLSNTTPLHVAALSLVLLIPLDLSILIQQDFFSHNFSDIGVIKSGLSSVLLGLLGTAFATWLFYVLMQRSGPVFASMVTYGIPFVAISWGLLAGEHITIYSTIALLVILLGVYLTNHKKSP